MSTITLAAVLCSTAFLAIRLKLLARDAVGSSPRSQRSRSSATAVPSG
ncbi:MAG: hypothetical protein R3F62_13470 [Planctomycetota bacterium]